MTLDGVKSLILETSGRIGQVAVAQGPTILGQRRLDETRRHARDLAPSVKELLAELGWKPRDVEVVFVSIGPGSYTGLRVGIMSAKAWAYATNCKLLGVETFAAIAQQATPSAPRSAGGLIHVIADAQQNNVYCQVFETLQDQPTPRSKLAIQPVTDWGQQLTPHTLVTGPGLRLHGALISPDLAVAEDKWDPRPESILNLGLARLARGEQDQVFALEPLYARRSSAEENWASKH